MLKKFLQYAMLSLLVSVCGKAAAQSVADSLYHELSKADTPADSISIMYNIFDCSSTDKQAEIAEQMYHVAKRHGDDNIVLDILRQIANLPVTTETEMHSRQQRLLERVDEIEESDIQKSTKIFINVRYTSRMARTQPEEARQKMLSECLDQYKNLRELDTYQQVEFLFYLCAYLRLEVDGEFLTKYLQELQTLIDQLPARDLFLRALFYVQAAVSYLNNGIYDKAIDANKTLLDIIDELEKQYKATGRQFRNYDRSKYVCYRRLLKCHKALEPEEVDIYYNRLMSLVDSSSEVKLDFEKKRTPAIFYMMAKKRYAEAIPLLKRQIEDPDNSREEYRYMVEGLIEAADSTGNKEDLLYALRLNNNLLKKRIEIKAAESFKELQIVYALNELKQKNKDLAKANEIIGSERHKELITIAFISLAVVILLLIVVFILYRRAKKLSNNLYKSNEVIVGERDALRRTQKDLIEARDKAKMADHIKTDFVNNMSHEIRTPLSAIVEYSNLISDCAEEDKRSYIKRFADIISLNTDLVLTLVNDVLDLPALENAKLSVTITPSSVSEICHLVLDSVKKRLNPDVNLIFANEGQSDIMILTDQHRVEQVLLNLLSNAAKFTEKGSITLAYSLSEDNKKMTFTVTDSGIGIPRGKEEVIFSRFEKLNSATQGNGLGLYIGRLLAELLKGELRLDPDYRKGARFIFTIPVA